LSREQVRFLCPLCECQPGFGCESTQESVPTDLRLIGRHLAKQSPLSKIFRILRNLSVSPHADNSFGANCNEPFVPPPADLRPTASKRVAPRRSFPPGAISSTRGLCFLGQPH